MAVPDVHPSRGTARSNEGFDGSCTDIPYKSVARESATSTTDTYRTWSEIVAMASTKRQRRGPSSERQIEAPFTAAIATETSPRTYAKRLSVMTNSPSIGNLNGSGNSRPKNQANKQNAESVATRYSDLRMAEVVKGRLTIELSGRTEAADGRA